jgi:chaperonin cofactor prefoldin
MRFGSFLTERINPLESEEKKLAAEFQKLKDEI